MLDIIRRKQKSVVIKFVFWGIIATFVGTIFLVWGKGDDRTGAQGNLAAVVNGVEIPYEEYQSSYSNLYRMYQNVYRDQFTPAVEKQLNLPKQAMDMLIEQILMNQEAKDRGIKVTQNELIGSIASIPAFQQNGAFSKDLYIQALNYQRLTPDMFEANQRRSLLAEKLLAQIEAGISVSDQDIETEYIRQNEKVGLSFVRFAPPLFEEMVAVDEEKLKAFFAAQSEQFRTREKISLQYLQFDPARYEQDLSFTSEELEKYYRNTIDRYEIPEQVEASHILIKVSENAADEEREKRRALASSILDKITSGEDFAKLAETSSDDPGSAAQGGKLGYFGRGQMVPSFEEAAFALQPGEISGLVESSFGIHIIKVTGRIEAGIKKIADVMDEVRAGLAIEKAGKIAFEKAMDAYNINRKSGDLSAAAATNDLGLKETGFFDRDSAIDGLGRNSEILAAAFSLDSSELARPVKTEQGVILFKVKDRKLSTIPELDEVRPAVEKAYRKVESEPLAIAAATAFLGRLKEGVSIKDAAQKMSYELEESGLFSRSYGDFVPKIGTSKELVDAAFNAEVQTPLPVAYEVGDSHYVAALTEKIPADMAELTVEKMASLRETLMGDKKNEAQEALVASLRSKAEIAIYVPLEKN